MKRALLTIFLLTLAAGLPLKAETPSGMVLVPAGKYKPLFRADTDSKTVEVKSFLLDEKPVTNAEYLEFVKANPRWERSRSKRIFADQEYLKLWQGDSELGTNAAPASPVTYVSWFAAKAYCQWKGKRLPATAEWEYAAAASPTRVDGKKDRVFMGEIRRWYSSPSPGKLSNVGQGLPNCFGIYDLHGLIWEWVADFSTAMVTGDARGDTGLERQLFCGSGSQGAKDRDDFPGFMRYGFRSSLKAAYTVHNLGFRCARDLETQ